MITVPCKCSKSSKIFLFLKEGEIKDFIGGCCEDSAKEMFQTDSELSADLLEKGEPKRKRGRPKKELPK